MPPGIWWLSTRASITAARVVCICSAYLGRIASRRSPMSSRAASGTFGSRAVPASATAMGSTAGWDVRSASGARQTSRMSKPASAALSALMDAMPLV